MDAKVFAVQLLRDQIGKRVYPVHRLDRKTAGVLLFAKTKESNVELQKLFRERKVKKTYRAIVRGYVVDQFTIDYALHNGKIKQEAKTMGQCLQRFEAPWPSAGFETSRYSLVELQPVSGRHHQLRKHMAHIMHPIIGDRPHGCNKQNRLWKERFGMMTMLLHASRLTFEYQNEIVDITSKESSEFMRALSLLV